MIFSNEQATAEMFKIQVISPNGKPATNVKVNLNDRDYITDDKGFIQIENIPNGTYKVVITINNKEYIQSIVLGAAVSQKTLTIKLSNSSISPIIYMIGAFGTLCIGGIIIYLILKKFK